MILIRIYSVFLEKCMIIIIILILNSLFIRILEQGEQDRSRERKEVVRQKEMSI